MVAEKIDRISRLPLIEAERLVNSIRSKGARLAIPGIVDLSELAHISEEIARIVLEAVQEMMLKIALQVAHEDYEVRRERQKQGIALAKQEGRYKGRKARGGLHEKIITLRQAGHSIAGTAVIANCSISQVKRIWAGRQNNTENDAN